MALVVAVAWAGGCDRATREPEPRTPISTRLAFKAAFVRPEQIEDGWSHTIDVTEDDATLSLFCDGGNRESVEVREFLGRNFSAPNVFFPRSQFRQSFAILVLDNPRDLFEDLATCSPFVEIDLRKFGDASMAIQMTNPENLNQQSTKIVVSRNNAIMMLDFDAYEGRDWSIATIEGLAAIADAKFADAVEAMAFP